MIETILVLLILFIVISYITFLLTYIEAYKDVVRVEYRDDNSRNVKVVICEHTYKG